MCIDIVEIWFGIANGQISLIFDRVTYPRVQDMPVVLFQENNLSEYWWIFTKLVVDYALILQYSRLSLSRIPRDCLKYFEISVLWHIRFAELRKN